MGSFFALLASFTTLVLWAIGSGRRLLLVKGRIARDWETARQHLDARQRLLFQLGGQVEMEMRETLLTAHEELTSALQEVTGAGGPLKSRLKRLVQAERTLQAVLVSAKESEDLDGAQDRLTFALETYNDGVRLLRRLKGGLFHWPIAMVICPRRVDLFETGFPADKTVVKLKFET